MGTGIYRYFTKNYKRYLQWKL